MPAYFHDGQRNATKRAGELAGFEVLRVLNEPTAAALAYGLDKLADKSRAAVYDFGGGTFDLSLLEMQDGVFQVIATHGDTRLGGDDLDHVVAVKMLEKAGIDEMQVSRELMIRWLGEAERVKCALSANERECFSLPFYFRRPSMHWFWWVAARGFRLSGRLRKPVFRGPRMFHSIPTKPSRWERRSRRE